MVTPLLFHGLIIAASLVILSFASDLAVLGISQYARKLGLSDYIIGVVVVSIAASMPELVSAVNGALAGSGGIIFGTILGANLVEITLVLGAFALVGKKIVLAKKSLDRTQMLMIWLNLLPFALIIDGRLSRIDGGILVTAYLGYLGILWVKEGKLGKIKKSVKFKNIYRDGIIFAFALVAILISSTLLVSSSITMANIIGITPFYIALVVIGIGSSFSDASVGIRSVLQGHEDVGFGNIMGSNIIKSLLFLGVIALFTPFSFGFGTLINILIFTAATLGVVAYFMKKKYMTWEDGLVMLIIYALFIAIEYFLTI